VIGRHLPIEKILIRIRCKPVSWGSKTETKIGMMVNSVLSVPYHQNLPDLRPFSSPITKNWRILQFSVIGDENGLKSGRFW
jgi:hypothetical protein